MLQLCMDALSQQTLDGPGQRQTDMVWEMVMHFSESQENPAMLQDIQSSSQVPKGRKNDCDLFSNPGQFLKKSDWIFDMLHGVRAEDLFKLVVSKREAINRVDQCKIGQVRMIDNVRVDAASISLAAADVEVPLLFMQDAFLEDTVTQKIKRLGEDG